MRKALILAILVAITSCTAQKKAETPEHAIPVPTREQLAFQDMELGVFVHFSIDAFTDTNDGSCPASSFNPTELDVEQWVRTAKEIGAKFIILTARHEQGFCLWPTEASDYSVKNSPYKDGKGDIVREFIDACKKYGIRPGLYTAPWIDAHWEREQPDYVQRPFGDCNKFDDPGLYERVLAKERQEYKELMTNYGDLVFFWNDHFGRSEVVSGQEGGGQLRKMYANLTSYAHELQPHCLVLGRDVEHVGNEKAEASYPLWNSMTSLDSTLYTISDTYMWDKPNYGRPDGIMYRPQIAPCMAFTRHHWMWVPGLGASDLESVMTAYYHTVGRGSSIIINFPPNNKGKVDDDIIRLAKDFGNELRRRFSNPLAKSESPETESLIDLGSPKPVNHVVLMEDLKDGQRIASYTLEAKVDGQWKVIVDGKTIGHKRIDVFDTVQASQIRFKVTDEIAPARMRSIEIFCVEKN